MKNFWKCIVFIGLFVQLGFAHNTNHDASISFQKESDTELSKESLSSSHFIQPSIDRGTLNQNHNTRIPVGVAHYPTELQSVTVLRENTPKIVLSDQDIDRYNSVSILLFPFHIFW